MGPEKVLGIIWDCGTVELWHVPSGCGEGPALGSYSWTRPSQAFLPLTLTMK